MTSPQPNVCCTAQHRAFDFCLTLSSFLVLFAFGGTAVAANNPLYNLKDNPKVKDRLAVHLEQYSYDWEGDNSTSGRQSVTPVTLTYKVNDNLDVGLRTAYIDSRNTTVGREGHVATQGDTNVSAAYAQELPDNWNIRYNLDYNIPTGKETLSGTEKNAIMDGSLVQQTRFGEGENVTPGIVVTKVVSPNANVGVGLSRTIKGKFDPNGDVTNDELDPGDETRLSLQGHFAKGNTQVIGGMNYTKSDETKRDNTDYYRKGDSYDTNVTVVHALPKDQRITVGIRHSKQDPDYYISSITGNLDKESRNVNGKSLYTSVEYAKTWRGQHTVRVNADKLKIDANSYDQLNDLYNAGRNKTQFGLGYDYQINQKARFYTDLKQFEMQDKATPATLVDTKYTGTQISAGLDWAF